MNPQSSTAKIREDLRLDATGAGHGQVPDVYLSAACGQKVGALEIEDGFKRVDPPKHL